MLVFCPCDVYFLTKLYNGWLQVEADRIAFEIEKKKEKERELEQERSKKMVRLTFFMLELHSLDLSVWFNFRLCFSWHSASFCNYLGSCPLPQTTVGRHG